MLKLIGAILLIAAGTLAGYSESRKLSVRVASLEGVLRFLTEACAEIRYAAPDVGEIVRRHGNGLALLEECAGRMRGGQPFTFAWEESLRFCREAMALREEDSGLLRDFGAGFGASDVDGQLAHCGLFTRLVEARLESARDEKSKKGRLYLALGVLCGLSAALLLC